ncbi:Meiotic nuclear division protein 1 [Mycena chlorophos]|uniref:Meiotic nuclear division protein 1 n=1 Tax=Mycena chlorophos TaxID=658473 RepID=A0A8H6VQU2_MYCCL|nr:Meiotic nuclear division protein 1 [Mycena chlorophos]
MAPRGLSADEKRVRLVGDLFSLRRVSTLRQLELFHETKDFYQLKELEKARISHLAPKNKGIVQQSVKEVLQGLVDDGLVQSDKIGACNIFWAFPSQRGATLHNQLKETRETRASYLLQQTQITKEKEGATAERVDTETRQEQLAELARLRKTHAALLTELELYGACNPVELEKKRRFIFLAHEAASRWTDNFGMLMGHCTQTLGADSGEIRQSLGVEDTYDDI